MNFEEAEELLVGKDNPTNNCISICGVITEEPIYSHNCREKAFYQTTICVRRKESDTVDFLKLLIHKEILESAGNLKGEYVKIEGCIKTYKDNGSGKTLKVNVFVEKISKIEKTEDTSNNNLVFLDGYICQKPYYYVTGIKKYSIATSMLAVNRKNTNISYYISFIAWDKRALKLSNMELGTRIRVLGRLQSRKYEKNGKEYETYEVSTFAMKVLE